MTKRNLSQQQTRRIKQTHQARLTATKKTSPSVIEQEGLLLSYHGKQAIIEHTNGQLFRCQLRQHLGRLTAGDKVIWQTTDEHTGVIIALCPRHSVLGRPDKKGVIKPIAANIDQIIIVIAPQPPLITSLLDSYLVIAETLGIQPLILINKIDLLLNRDNIIEKVAAYQQLNYPIIKASTYKTYGLDKLSQRLKHKTSVFVGQSGVGKSSIIAGLIPDLDIRIGKLSSMKMSGKHTTSNSYLYHLTNDGNVIDSPGIREFGLWHMEAKQIAQGFIEFQPFLGRCQFSDCQHQQEPGCALRQAVSEKKIDATRFSSYQKLVNSQA